MKKKLSLMIFCLFILLPAFAGNWVEATYKTYVNIDYFKGDAVYYWVKFLDYNGTMKATNNKKSAYQLAYYSDSCSANSSTLLDSYFYDSKGKVVDSYHSVFNEPERIVPQSVGESIHKYVCTALGESTRY